MTSDPDSRVLVHDKTMFERALHALPKNRDYAHELLAQCVLHEPGNLRFVEMMLDNLAAWFRATKKKPRPPGFRSNAAFKRAARVGNGPEVFRLGMARLVEHPWHVPTLRAMARACEKNHLNEVELRYLKQALDANPHDRQVNRHCAASLARMGQFDQAIACWHRVEQDRKGDKEAKEMILKLSLEKVEFAKLKKLHPPVAGETEHPVHAAPAADTRHEPAPPRAEPKVEHAIPSHLLHVLPPKEVATEPKPVPPPRVARARRRGVPWAELALALSLVALLLQLFPSILELLYENLRVSIFVGNVIVLAILLGIRRWATRKPTGHSPPLGHHRS